MTLIEQTRQRITDLFELTNDNHDLELTALLTQYTEAVKTEGKSEPSRNQTLLAYLIDKARGNGWEYEVRGFNYDPATPYWWDNPYMLQGLLMSHEFAKALFGSNEICTICGSDEFKGGKEYIPGEQDEYWSACARCGAEPLSKNEFDEGGNTLDAYQYHLQQLALIKPSERLEYAYRTRAGLSHGEKETT